MILRNKARAIEDINISIALVDFGVSPLVVQCKLNDIDRLRFAFYYQSSDEFSILRSLIISSVIPSSTDFPSKSISLTPWTIGISTSY